MLNILIANKNLENLQNLQNYISQYIPDIRVGYLASDGKDVLEALKTQHYDIVVMDTNLPKMDGFDVLQKLSSIKQVELKHSFIVLTKNENMIKNLNKHDLVYKAFKSRESLSMIIHTIQQIVDSRKEKDETTCIRNKIINELQTIGFNLSHKGTHYLAESVVLMATTEKNNENLSKHIYPIVSKIFNKDLNNIKCNITSATEAACKNITDDILLNYFKLSTHVKPTTKMIIYSILKKLNK